jgi:3-hydroxybutyryl-CoA dehydrogenase
MNKKPADGLKTVGILGAGTMGSGIAQVAALAGYAVLLYDIEDAFLKRGQATIDDFLAKGKAKGKVSDEEIARVEHNLSTTTRLDDFAGADLIIEAVPESMALKQELFQKLDKLCPARTILASNTSSLSITAIGGKTTRPENVAGLHFFNPVPLMKLVEVIEGQRTSGTTLDTLCAFARSLGKTPVVAKDTPGFIVNRVARPFYGEALRLLGDNADPAETIDTVLCEAGGFRMGPFALMDLIGIDVNLAVTQSVYNAYFQEPRYRPHPIQQRMVDAGLLGRKTGRGFYSYD